MMKKIWLAFLLMLSMINVSFVHLTIAQNAYTKKNLISFTWGKGNYQLGTNYFEFYNDKGDYIGLPDAGSEVEGPSAIKVDNKGYIYVLDKINRRLLQFDNLGKYKNSLEIYSPSPAIGIDSQNNIYLDSGGNYIEVYNAKLKFIQRINYGPVNIFTQKIWINESQGTINLYDKMSVIKVYYKKPGIQKKIQGGTIEIKETKKTEFNTPPYNFLKEDRTEAEINIPIDENKVKVKIKPNNLDIISSLEVIEKTKEGIFFSVLEANKNFTNFLQSIYLLDNAGLAYIVSLDQDEQLFYLQEEHSYIIDIDQTGNIYHLWIQKKGVKLVKWERLM